MEDSQGMRSIDRTVFALDRIMESSLGDLYLDEIHDGTIQPYVVARLKKVSASTVSRELSVLTRILRLAVTKYRTETGMTWLAAAPELTHPKGEKRAPYPMTPEEQRRFLAELPPHLRAATEFALHTGMRSTELCQAQWGWEVEVPELGVSVLVLPATFAKNGEERVIVLNSVARRILDEQRDNGSEYIFTYNGKPMSRLLNTSWKKARVRAGLPHLRAHDTRHTFGHRLRAVGVSHEERKLLLGHKAGDVTTHYSAAELSVLVEYAERIVNVRQGTVLRSVQRKFNTVLNQVAAA